MNSFRYWIKIVEELSGSLPTFKPLCILATDSHRELKLV